MQTKKITITKTFISAYFLIILAVAAGGAYAWKKQHASALSSAQGVAVRDIQHVKDEKGRILSEALPVHSMPVHTVPKGAIPVAILMYHHVGMLPEDGDGIRRDLTVSPENFTEQVEWLHANGYQSVTLEQVYLASQKLFALPKKAVVFTFDDGYKDVFDFALPVLQKYGYVGSFAIAPGLLEKPDYATWAQVLSAKTVGMEVVSHTETHFDGSSSKYSSEFIKQNLTESLKELDSHLGAVPRILVYPYGHFTPEYINIAQSLGFSMGLTTAFGKYVDPNDLMHTPRVRVHGTEPLSRFVEILTGNKKTATK